ncbi:MAG: trypsin-like peptidase domain-containing protein [Anaerolineales bacterium]
MTAQPRALDRFGPTGLSEALTGLSGDLARIAARVRPSVVRISNGNRSAGAGVVLHERGLVVTNAHVIKGRRIEILDYSNRPYQATILRVDRGLDLAALMIHAESLPSLSLGDSRSIQPGAWVLAFGHPYGVLGAATAGIVIGSGMDLPEMGPDARDWLAMSLRLRPGNSGGPVVDTDGRLVGLNTMMAGPGVGLAVPGHVVKKFLKRAIV